ncbi:MAG: SIMPL domain-containing protein [Thaumarchaeota archaeon]|nr:SIMPL domain-containing protein [Nitrososphaerota archaeon]
MALEQRMVKVTLAAVVVALIVGSAYVGVVAFQSLASATPKRTISVSGSGSVTLSPDEAQVFVGTVTQANDAQQASSANARIMDDLVARLYSLGIANDSISTVSYYISPLYVTRSNGSQTIVGYQAQHTLSVRIQNSNLNQLGAKVAQVIDSAVGAGANQVSGVQAETDDQPGTTKRDSRRFVQGAGDGFRSWAQDNWGGIDKPRWSGISSRLCLVGGRGGEIDTNHARNFHPDRLGTGHLLRPVGMPGGARWLPLTSVGTAK